jgi:hypothetical protein
MLPGTFEMTTSIRIWLWELSIASLKSMLNVMNNDYIGIPTQRLFSYWIMVT